MKSVGIIGVGLVGTAISKILLKAGYRIVGYDINSFQIEYLKKLGGNVVKSPAAVANECNIIILCLMNSDIVMEVLNGTGGILRSNKRPLIIIDTTTGDPIKTIEISKLCKVKNIKYLNATISGSSDAIANKKGVFMVGGDKKDYDEMNILFDELCENHIYAGPSGSGSKAKLAVNLVLGLNRVALAEGIVFAQLLGLGDKTIKELFMNTFAYSKIMDLKIDRMLNGNFEKAGKLSQHLKDVNLILQYANKNSQNLPLSKVHKKILENGVSEGDGDLDNSALINEIRRNRLNIIIE